MIKLIALYKQPADKAAFLDHYQNIHAPLAAQIPGVSRVVLAQVTANAMGGESPYFMIGELHFPDRETFDQAMKSPQNKAAGKDMMSFARDLVTLIVAEE